MGGTFSLLASSIDDADAMDWCSFSIIEKYHPPEHLPTFELQKVIDFKHFGVFSLASALKVLYIFLSGLGAGLSASRRAWERVSLHEPLEYLNNQFLQI